MSDFFAMDGDGPYVWAAYGITLVVLIWNIWAARLRLKRNLREAARNVDTAEPARRPKVSQL
jgi:heme exporter protein D